MHNSKILQIDNYESFICFWSLQIPINWIFLKFKYFLSHPGNGSRKLGLLLNKNKKKHNLANN